MSEEDELYDYYLSDDLLSRFSHHFSMDKAIDDFISSTRGKSREETNNTAQQMLGRYLRELSTSLAKAEKDSIDHTGEIMYTVAEKTGIRFPSVPQRLLELGFMSTRPQDKLSVTISSPKVLVLRIPSCTAYTMIKQRLGEEKTKDLPCIYGCLANSKMLFDQLGIATQLRNTAKINEKGFCEFTFNSEI
jgi:hypothetical protein